MQVSQVLRALPVVLSLSASWSAPLGAQGGGGGARYRVVNDGEWFHQEASGKRLARLARGAVVSGATTDGDWIRVTLDGWIFGTSVGPAPASAPTPGFDLAVTRAPEENLRSVPGGALVARLAEGFLLMRVSEVRPWVRVTRTGWMRREGLEEVARVATTSVARGTDSTARDSGPSSPTPPPASPRDSSRAQPSRQTTLYRAPDGPPAGQVTSETPLKVLSRTGEWSRVQLEGWVKTSDLQTAPAGVLVGVSAAELRADPQRYTGQTLRWDVQFIAVQTADDLRPDIPAGATYLLTRGPLPERGFVYVVVSSAQAATVRPLTPLSVIRITARVRSGRSRYLGNPVVDLVSLEAQP